MEIRIGLVIGRGRLSGDGRSPRRDHVREDSVEVVLGSPPDSRPDLLGRRNPVEHVLDSLAVDAVVGDEDLLRGRARGGEDTVGQRADGDPLGRADVEDLAADGALVHQAFQRADRVGNMAEAPRLSAVAMDLERFAGERAVDEARNHHPVLAALPWADRVEEPGDHAVEVTLAVVAEREMLVHRLGVRVQPAPRRRRAVDPAGVLLERFLLAVVAVDLRARGHQHALAEATRDVEDVLGPLDVRDHRVHRLLDDQTNPHRCGKVVDDVALVHELVDCGDRKHRVDDEVEVASVLEAGDVRAVTGREVVERPDLPPVREQERVQVGTDEPGAAGHEGLSAHRPQAYWRRGTRLSTCSISGAPGSSARAAWSSRRASAKRRARRYATPSSKRNSTARGSFSTPLRSGGIAAAGEAATCACVRYGSTASGSSRRAQRRSEAGDGDPSSTWLESRDESQGGAKASNATAAETTAIGTASRLRRSRLSPEAAPAPSRTKNGRPTAGIVQFQSPEACTSQYAAAPNAAVAVGSRPRMPWKLSASSGSNPTPSRTRPTIPSSLRASSSIECARTGVSPLSRSTRYAGPNPRAPIPASGCSRNSCTATRQKS